MLRRRFLALGTAPVPAPSTPTPPPISGGLEPFVPTDSAPWDERRAAHLVRRLAFGVSVPDLTEALLRSPSEAVAYFVQQALGRSLPDTPAWYDSHPNGGQQNTEWVYEWYVWIPAQ